MISNPYNSRTSSGGGSGTVTSVGVSSSTLTISGSPITTSGTITVDTPITIHTPSGTTPATGAVGDIWFDTTNSEYYECTSASPVTWVAIGAGGSGTVTSVGLSDTSTTPIYSVSGSPVTTSGTLDLTLATQNANLVFAGPSSGVAAQPTFRSLVAADIPALSYISAVNGTAGEITASTASGVVTLNLAATGVTGGSYTNANITVGGDGRITAVSSGTNGTVTSVGLSDGSTTPIYTISGSPVTTSGTLTFTLNSQTANQVFAAPNGSAGQPGFRALVNADLPTSGVTAGSYTNANITVNSQGVVTAASNGSGGGSSLISAAVGNYTFPYGSWGLALASPAIAANSLTVGSSFRVTFAFDCPAGTSGQYTEVRITIGPNKTTADTIIAQVSGNPSGSQQYFSTILEVVCTTTGTSGLMYGSYTFNTSGSTSVVSYFSPAVNTTIANYISIFLENQDSATGPLLYTATIQQIS